MAKFSELGIESDIIVGKGIDIEDLFDRHILIEKTIIQPTKFPGKNKSGLRMQMQVVLATFSEDGSYVKHSDGMPDGEFVETTFEVGWNPEIVRVVKQTSLSNINLKYGY